MDLAQSAVSPISLCSHKQKFSLANSGAQHQTPSSSLSLKPLSGASLTQRFIRLLERRSSGTLGFRSRRKGLLPITRASSSTGPFVSEESWGQGGDEGLENAGKTKKQEVKELKKRLIAGVDQTQLMEPHLLADPDSRFAEYYGVQVHHKIARPDDAVVDVDSSPSLASSSVAAGAYEAQAGEEQRENVPAILLHGFGASLFSWERVMPKLAEILGAPALAFDRPAFGFTSRTFPPPSSAVGKESQEKFKNPYTVAFSAAATLAFIEFLKSDQAIVIGVDIVYFSLISYIYEPLSVIQKILAKFFVDQDLMMTMLMNGEGARHSAGSLVAVDAYFQSPERIAALILVAPALVAPLLMQQISDSEKATKQESKLEGEIENEKTDSLSKVRAILLWIWVKFTSLIRMVQKLVQLVLNKVLGFLFRSPPAVWLVQKIMDKGGPWAVRTAFFDAGKADKEVLDGYTRPLQCRDWEKALLEYCLALIDNTEEQASGKKDLQDVECPVLLVTGDTDRIVPDWNCEKLAKVFPNAEFVRIKNCGHLPHEETPEEFLEIIKDWLSRTLIKTTTSREPAMSS